MRQSFRVGRRFQGTRKGRKGRKGLKGRMAQDLSSNILRVPWHNAPHFVVGVSCGADTAQDGSAGASPYRRSRFRSASRRPSQAGRLCYPSQGRPVSCFALPAFPFPVGESPTVTGGSPVLPVAGEAGVVFCPGRGLTNAEIGARISVGFITMHISLL
jgi:hypothetical protein